MAVPKQRRDWAQERQGETANGEREKEKKQAGKAASLKGDRGVSPRKAEAG